MKPQTDQSHLRYAGLPDADQRAVLEQIIRTEPLLMQVLENLREMALNDWLLVSGAIYNTVWNRLTGRPALTGIKDVDVTYFDDLDLSYEAEDAVIQRVAARFVDSPIPVEVRNQARVHLWFPQKFNQPFSPLKSSEDMLSRYASKTHAVGVYLDASDKMTIMAPFGLDFIFSFRIVPNHFLANNRNAHESKGARAKSVWPELSIEPW